MVVSETAAEAILCLVSFVARAWTLYTICTGFEFIGIESSGHSYDASYMFPLPSGATVGTTCHGGRGGEQHSMSALHMSVAAQWCRRMVMAGAGQQEAGS